MLSGFKNITGASVSRHKQPFRCPRHTPSPAPSRTSPNEQQQQQQTGSRSSVIVGSGLDGFLSLGALLKPEVAAIFSAVVAAGSVGLNYYGGLLTESKRVELQKELDREKQAEAVLQELASIISRYRGPLLESSVDLEQRLWHLATMTGEWYEAKDVLCGEEIAYTLFTLAQFLGFLEVVRREGPRERSFLAAGNPQGSDTLATLVEGFRFVLCASPATLQEWLSEPDAERDHPGARQRRAYVPRRGKRKAMMEGLGEKPGSHASIPLRVSRGAQRAIGSKMGATPLGAERHYTHSYATFLAKLKAEPDFACWLQTIETDLASLLTGPTWMGEANNKPHRWTRVLLMQQLLVDAIDLLDPDYVRVPMNRRIRLSPVAYAPLPNVEQYTAALTLLSGPMDTARFGHKGPNNEEHFQALQNLLHPERVVEAANQVRRAQQSNQNGTMSNRNGSASASGSKSGSPLSTTADDDTSSGSSSSSSNSSKVPSILPSFQLLPSVGATGVQLLQQLSGQGGSPPQPQQVQGGGKGAPTDPTAAAAAAAPPATPGDSDFGGTAVTAQPAELAARAGSPATTVAPRNGKKA